MPAGAVSEKFGGNTSCQDCGIGLLLLSTTGAQNRVTGSDSSSTEKHSVRTSLPMVSPLSPKAQYMTEG